MGDIYLLNTRCSLTERIQSEAQVYNLNIEIQFQMREGGGTNHIEIFQGSIFKGSIFKLSLIHI